MPSLKGKVAVVTGSNSGIGFETALGLSSAGATVILAVRNTTKGEEAKRRIYDKLKNHSLVQVMEMDLCSLDSIKKFSSVFIEKFGALDILINNAGVMMPSGNRLTEDGFEIHLGTNHLGHFALTARLLPALRKRPSRVVTVSSLAAQQGIIHFEDLNLKNRPGTWGAYAQSKLANVLFAIELNRRSEEKHWGVESIGAHPGLCSSTEIVRNGPGENSLPSRLQNIFGNFTLPPAEESAIPILYAATSNEVKGGEYYGPEGFWEIRDGVAKSKIPKRASSKLVAERLWNISAKLTDTQHATESVRLGTI